MLWRRYTFIFKGMKCEHLLVLLTFLWRWGRWMCFQNIQTISNFFSLSDQLLSCLVHICLFLFGCHTDWRESWKNIMAVCRVDNRCSQYFHLTLSFLLFYSGVILSKWEESSRYEAVFCYLSCSDFKLTIIQSLEGLWKGGGFCCLFWMWLTVRVSSFTLQSSHQEGSRALFFTMTLLGRA